MVSHVPLDDTFGHVPDQSLVKFPPGWIQLCPGGGDTLYTLGSRDMSLERVSIFTILVNEGC